MAAQLTTYVALLRGINVGGNNIIKMAELKVCFEQAGMAHVRTYINSGNVVFRSPQKDPRKLEAAIEKAIEARFTLPITVVLCSMAEMNGLIQHIPKKWETTTSLRLYVTFLRHTADKPAVMQQVAPREGVDEVAYVPGAMLWATDKSALTRSGLQKIAGTPLYKEITIRNYNSVRKIYALMQQIDHER